MTWKCGPFAYLFVRLNPKLKKTTIPDRDNILAMLFLYSSLVVFQLGGLHYRLRNSIKFTITLNEGLGWQLLGQNS